MSRLSHLILAILLLSAGACSDCVFDTAPSDADGDGWEVGDGDCDDSEFSVNPGVLETCNGIDDDCDGEVDEEATDATAWYADQDGDGHGDDDSELLACDAPTDHSAVGGDCDDGEDEVHPDAAEVCNDIDDDCDGLTDEEDPGLQGASTWYADADGDGYGAPGAGTVACERPEGDVANHDDCDDSDPEVHPSAVEVCDLVDNDCDDVADELCGPEVCDDGFDNDSDGLTDCEDGDCSTDGSCVELDCADGSDDDDDGLADCDDDDCWASSECFPGGVRSKVLGGRMVQHLHRHQDYSYGGGRPAARVLNDLWTMDNSARLYSVWGTVQVLAPSAAFWSASAARSTCQWSVSQASMAFYEFFHNSDSSFAVTAPVRAGFNLGSGCALTSSWFLPDEIVVRDARGYVDNYFIYSRAWISGRSWYAGSATYSSPVRTVSSWHYYETFFLLTTSTRDLGVNLGGLGSYYYAEP